MDHSESATVFAAHRGYSGIAPENTEAAFRKAVECGFGGMECDVWEIKKTGIAPELMIMHDENLHRMCGVDKDITGLTREELARYPVIEGNNIEKYGGKLPVPSYEQYLEIIAGSSLLPIIEIKSKNPLGEAEAISREAAQCLVQLLREKLGSRPVVFESFNLYSLYRLADILNGDANTELLYLVKRADRIREDALLEYKEKGISGISGKYTILSSGRIRRIQKLGLKVAVWTVDSRLLARKLARRDHVDYVISNKKVFGSR